MRVATPAHFPENDVDYHVDGGWGDTQEVGDFLILQPGDFTPEDLPLPEAETASSCHLTLHRRDGQKEQKQGEEYGEPVFHFPVTASVVTTVAPIPTSGGATAAGS